MVKPTTNGLSWSLWQIQLWPRKLKKWRWGTDSFVNKVFCRLQKGRNFLKKKLYQQHSYPPSAATKRPTACEPPPPVSTNSTSDTMTLSSSTEPQPMQTASPRAWSTSMSAQPQFLHTFGLMALPPSLMGNEIMSSSQCITTSMKSCLSNASLKNLFLVYFRIL